MTTLEKKNELEEELSEEAKLLFVDKDTIMNSVSASHDHHTLKLDNKEDDITTRANRWVRRLFLEDNFMNCFPVGLSNINLSSIFSILLP